MGIVNRGFVFGEMCIGVRLLHNDNYVSFLFQILIKITRQIYIQYFITIQMKITPRQFHILSLTLMSIGYLWLWCFNRNPHVLIKFTTTQAYFLTWLYFLLLVLKKNSILGISIERQFQLNFVLQLFVTPMYWALVHTPMVESKRFPQYEVNWNIYIHVIPMLLLIAEYTIMKRQFYNRWQDTAIFFYAFSMPINLLYSHLHRPVYQILLYDDFGDYVLIVSFGFVMIGLQFICYYFFRFLGERRNPVKKVARQTVEAINKKL